MIEVVPGGAFSYDRYDPTELPEKMMTSIVLGVDMEDSDLVRTDEDRALWERIAHSVAWVLEHGGMPVYEFGALDDEDVE